MTEFKTFPRLIMGDALTDIVYTPRIMGTSMPYGIESPDEAISVPNHLTVERVKLFPEISLCFISIVSF